MKVSPQLRKDASDMGAIRVATEVPADLSEIDGPVPQIARALWSGFPLKPPLEPDGLVHRENRSQSPSSEKNSLRQNAMNRALLDLYLCPEHFVDIQLAGRLSDETGYFRFGPNITCYGRSNSGYRTTRPDAALYDALTDMTVHGTTVYLTFDPTDVIDNLRLERYANQDGLGTLSRWERLGKDIYYFLRPLMHVKLRKHIQRARLIGWRNVSFPHWPVDTTVEDLCEKLLLLSMNAQGIDKVPFIWFWPDGAQSCVAMTHDVETERGRDFCAELMSVNESFGIKASFQVVPEGRYHISEAFIQAIRDRGFEINVQDLNHDGNLFREREEFRRRTQKINKYAETYGAAGFRAAVLYRNLDWYDALHFSFDMSIPNVAHLDPQKGGCCTVMPYFFGKTLEIPVTTTQDYMLFHLLNDYSLKLWKAQTNLIAARNGLVSFIVHPDYIVEEKAKGVYRDLLAFLRESARRQKIWFALPGEIDRWWRARHEMRIAGQDGNWRIEGEGAEHAKLAFARMVDGQIEYEVGV
jgi:hypothetical protein